MAIYVPGKRSRHGRKVSSKRSAVAVLNMTAMVDMFTVLCVFLLQNYASTNQVLNLPDKVDLPAASEVKELKPSTVVIVAEDGIMLNDRKVAEFRAVKEQKENNIQGLGEEIARLIREGEAKKKSLGSQLRQAVNSAKNAPEAVDVDEFKKVTIQSDKKVDFLTIKKVMYTVTEAGMEEINFAVLKKEDAS